MTVLHVSKRRTCRAVGQVRSNHRYQLQPADPEEDRLRARIIALAKEYGWYGYRTVTDLLRQEGWAVGVYNIWWQEGLQVPQHNWSDNAPEFIAKKLR